MNCPASRCLFLFLFLPQLNSLPGSVARPSTSTCTCSSPAMSQDDSDELLTILAWCAGGLALLCCCCYLSCCRFRKVDSAIKDVPVVCGGPKSDSTTSGHTGGGSRSVKIITYNTWCLPSALCCRDPAGRASMICERLLQGDYVSHCLRTNTSLPSLSPSLVGETETDRETEK